ncbi:threonine dehydratase [Halioglobus maricola]|uniref:Threonine dehydratase n=1 Tax=Halioglobus maricola TaxID=2601894 RepID=A0A5P9NLY7_9GAMM|nr:threonine dehydratase [Halioglobus maricola]QFU76797.1 threonine dehydratase [Halioglobus maricola]
MAEFSLEELEAAAALVYPHMQASPLLRWPLLDSRLGCEAWVKHENHNPTGAFKVRGGLVYLQRLQEREPDCPGVVTATRGNHGQSIALAARLVGLRAVVVVPEGNSESKNRAMEALGCELVVHGRDFDVAVEHSLHLEQEQGLHRIPSFHADLVCGVGSYALEMFRAQPTLERVYVSIGLGSGICGVISARDALGLNTEVIGVVSSEATCYQQSLAAGECVSTASANTLADGMAVRVPNPEALAMMQGSVSRIVAVTDDEVKAAMSHYFEDTHNIAEGAGAAALAAALSEREDNAGRKLGLVLTGGNVDSVLYQQVLP